MNSGASTINAIIDEDCDGMRLDRALAMLMPDLSRERLKQLILDGKVAQGTDPVATPSYKVSEGQHFRITVPPPLESEAVPQNIPLSIAYEDEYLVVVDKPAGLVVHPAAGNLDGTLVNALLYHCKGQLSGIGGVARPGIVHRIDKDTSGLLVVAKTDKAHEGLATQFAAHSIDRRYLAIASGRPSPASGTVRGWIGRSSHDRKKMAVQREGRGKHAVTHYETREMLNEAALVECRLETGRTHQVRVHMAHIGHALVGDPLYGRPRKAHRRILDELGFVRQALHAARLGFIHPIDSRAMAFESQIPDDMQELLRHLRV